MRKLPELEVDLLELHANGVPDQAAAELLAEEAGWRYRGASWLLAAVLVAIMAFLAFRFGGGLAWTLALGGAAAVATIGCLARAFFCVGRARKVRAGGAL